MIEIKKYGLEEELIDFIEFSDHARIWIYQSERDLSDEETEKIEKELAEFSGTWTSHNVKMKAKSKVMLSRFIILAVDEKPEVIGGCGIDKSVHIINKLERDLGITLIDRAKMCMFINDKVNQIPFTQIPERYKLDKLTDEQFVFNTMIQNLNQLRNEFLIPFKDSPFYRLV